MENLKAKVLDSLTWQGIKVYNDEVFLSYSRAIKKYHHAVVFENVMPEVSLSGGQAIPAKVSIDCIMYRLAEVSYCGLSYYVYIKQ